MAIESKNCLVWLKAMSRGQNLPLDASEIHASLAEAQIYAQSPIAYGGQTIKALLEDGKYHEYILQPSESGYTLEEIGLGSSDSKQYVMVVESLPEEDREEGILYINTANNTGSIWNGSEWKTVIKDVDLKIDTLTEKVNGVETELENKAPIENPVFSGVVKIGEDEVAIKSYVDGLFANLVSSVPKVIDGEHPFPETDYRAGEQYRVALAGNYAGQDCEIGDLIIVVKDYNSDSASNEDFIVLQANIDGAVTSTADVTTIGEIAVFDSITGKVIKGSTVQITSLNDAIAKMHEHANKEVLDTYDKSQEELLNAAKADTQALVTAHTEAVNEVLNNKADKADSLEGYGITDAYNKTEIDSKISTLTENLNTKVTSADVDTKIETAKSDILADVAIDATEKLALRIGSIPEGTDVKTYVDNAIGSGGTSSAEAIATAKEEAITTSKEYTDEQISKGLAVTEF